MLRITTPEWEPLLDLASDHVDDFMWMFAVELEDGTRMQAYKHYWTREYLFLDGEGKAYVYFDGGRYEERVAQWLLSRVLRERRLNREWYSFVGHNDPDQIEIDWTRSATKHRISRARSGHVVRHCGLRFRMQSLDGPLGREDDRVLFLGEDTEGAALEVIALDVGEEAFLVIHAMELRSKHHGRYEQVRRWRR